MSYVVASKVKEYINGKGMMAAGASGYLSALTGFHFYVVNNGSERDVVQKQCISYFRSSILT